MSSLMLINPKKRKHNARRRKNPLAAGDRHKNPIGRFKRRLHGARRRKNPIQLNGVVDSTIMPAAQQAAGAVTLDLAMGYLPLPASVAPGTSLYPLAKAAVAVALGIATQSFVKKGQLAKNMAQGALAGVLHDEAKSLIQTHAPTLKLAGNPGSSYGVAQLTPVVSEYLRSNGVGEYLHGNRMGEFVRTTEAPDDDDFV